MAVRIRLARHGRKKAPYYRMVVADSRFPRDGRFIEILGYYHPLEKDEEKQVKVDEEKALMWLDRGAIPTDTCRSLLRKQGILRKHHEAKQAARLASKAASAPAEA
ncbi:MAG TPA: 30S ribosomal protein S16 [Candidatus Sumerlaeota bacterium]|nr:30S ribosomal protein S16 [Candidatus Sumerlaeota bacterium]HOR27474.1 30S ribosomal protein S16 [Candidatus Sumerlaeota bacterium]HPK03418.1 30S ribosomal protein S16 [Candidatus Sumerlaeota bacterium]